MKGIGLRETLRRIRTDARSYADFCRENPQWGAVRNPLFAPGVWSIALYRLSRYFFCRGMKAFSRVLHWTNILATRAELSPQSDIGEGAVILRGGGLIVSAANIGRYAVFTGWNALGGGGVQKDIGAGPGQPVVGDHFFMSPGSFVLGARRIGNGVTAGPKCFVRRDVGDGELVAV